MFRLYQDVYSLLLIQVIIVNVMLLFVCHFHVSVFYSCCCSCCYFKCLCYLCLLVILLCKYLYYGVTFTFNCYSLTCLVYWYPQKIGKKKVRYKLDLWTYFVLRYERVHIHVYVFLHPCVGQVPCLNMCSMLQSQKWNNHVTRVYYFTIPQKRNSMKILARSSIFPKFQIKVNFKVTASRQELLEILLL